jgi:hypothetical protein
MLPKMSTEEKPCSRCKVTKSKSEFHKDKSHSDGLRSVCKVCASEQRKEYYTANKEQSKAYYKANSEYICEKQKAYYKANTEAVCERHEEYRAGNAEVIAAREKAYRAANAEVIRERQKAYYADNTESLCEQHREYYRAHSEAIIENNVQCDRNRRKADPFYALTKRIRSLMYTVLRNQGYSKSSKTYEILGCTREEFFAHIESQFVEGMGWHNRSEWHLDHIYPVSKAVDEEHLLKLNHYTNFQPLWAFDNLSKGNKIPVEGDL